MAEFTELFPLGQQLDGWVHMYVYIITFDPPTVIIVCIIVTLFFFIFYRILCGLFFWFLVPRPNEYDLEEGSAHLAYGASDPSRQIPISHAFAHSNLRAWTLMTAFGGVFYEKRGQMLRALNKLPPLVGYGEHNVIKRYGDCAICLEDFELGQFCQVFPVCSHIFHSNCIDNWLQKKLTCPVCRSCI
ncbi:hypothetical protein VNO77_28257 [Canavalia gladiata]|uniref:RING-type E3 ubiquitin transferase n=1 Tax=Canavalia gladiata TaxID=3824 RepID=A0AAN9KYK3_CANGL